MVLRKLTLALLGMGVMLPGLSQALAIRDIQTKSALGQPLRVEIELSDLGDLSSEDIKVGLATQEDFQRLGIERVFFLTELRFEVVVNPGARSFIRIMSSKRVTEPFLDFVIRVSWPGNTRLQELPILLDPPVTAMAKPVAPEPVVVQAEPELPRPVAVMPAEPAIPDASLMSDEAGAVPGKTYQVRQRDSLWSIARRVRPGKHISVPSMMQALYRANPQAFVASNINMLKNGEILKVPTLNEAVADSQREASRAVASQSAAAAKSLSRKQINATPSATKAQPVVAQPRAEMRLVAPVASGQASGAGLPSLKASTRQGATAPASSGVSLTASGGKNSSAASGLAGQVAGLESKLKSNDQKIAMQNARLARLEAQLKARAAQEQQAKQKAGDKGLERKAIATLACGVATQSFMSTEAKAAEAPAASGSSMMPVVGGVVLLLIVAAIFFLKGKSKKNETPVAPPAPKPAAPVKLAEPVAAKPAPAPEVKKPVDPLEEAKAYLGLERFPQAVGVLNKALAQTPDRADLHLLLLDIFVKQNDRQSFDDQYARLESLGEIEALIQADELKSKFPEPPKAAPVAEHGALDFEHGLGKKQDDQGPSLEDLEKDFALSLSSPNLQAVNVEVKETPAAAPAVSIEEMDALLDNSLDFSFKPSAPVEAEPAPAAESALDLDFAFDAPAAAPAAAETELSLDSLDAFLEEQKLPEAKAPVAFEPVEEAPAFDFEKALADFKEEEVPAPAPLEPEAPAALEIDIPAMPEPVAVAAAAPVAQPAEEVVNLAEGLELEEFNVSLINIPVTDVPLRSETQTGLEALEGDFNFDDFATTPAAPALEPTPSLDAREGVDLGSAAAAFDAELGGAAESLDQAADDDVLASLDKEFAFLATTDENSTRLELARAYVEMGDRTAARDLLEEVIADGKQDQKTEAQGMLMRIS